MTEKSKIFIKAKLTASKSYLLGLVYFMICCILRHAISLSLDLLKFQSLWYQSRFHAIYSGTIFCCTVLSKITQWLWCSYYKYPAYTLVYYYGISRVLIIGTSENMEHKKVIFEPKNLNEFKIHSYWSFPYSIYWKASEKLQFQEPLQ